MTTINSTCPNCKAPLEVVVGRKSTARTVTCECGARYDYSCWVRTSTPGYDIHQVDLFPQREDRRSWTDTVRG